MNMQRVPIFYDTTLRDGNQSLKKPWDLSEKEIIFKKLVELNIPAIEIGFPAASKTEYEICKALAKQAPSYVVISTLARAIEQDIKLAAEVLQDVAHPRIQLFLAMNPMGLKYVLHRDINETLQIALQSPKCSIAKET